MSGNLNKKTQTDLDTVINILVQGITLPVKNKDHQLKGEYRRYRECHIRPDLILVYQIRDKELVLVLIDVGSHSYLF